MPEPSGVASGSGFPGWPLDETPVTLLQLIRVTEKQTTDHPAATRVIDPRFVDVRTVMFTSCSSRYGGVAF
jgi:hypothetical protein